MKISDIIDNLTIALKFLGGLGMILAVGAVLFLGFAGISLGFQWVWSMVPFGIAGFILSLIIIAVTFYFSRKFLPERETSLTWQSINKLEYLEILGYLYGAFLLLVSLTWFVLPNQVIQVFPSMKDSIGFYVIAPIFLYGIGVCFQGAVKGFYFFIWGGLFWAVCAIVGFYFVNYHVWNITEKIPSDYYLFGKAVFAFIFFIQILYILFFHIIPAKTEYHLLKKSNDKIARDNTEK